MAFRLNLPRPRPFPDPDLVSDAIKDLAERGWAVSFEELPERMNSHDRAYIIPYLDNECIVRIVRDSYLPNCSHGRGTPSTYDEALQQLYVPDLLRRLEQQ